MAKKLPQYQRDALLVLRTRLDPNNPANTASEEIKAHLKAIGGWLDSWVIPALDSIESENDCGSRWLRDSIGQHAYRMRQDMAAREVKQTS